MLSFIWSWLTDLINIKSTQIKSGVSVLFHAFSVDCLRGMISYKTGRLAHTIDYGSWLFTVLGQEDRAYECVLTKQYRY